MGMYDTFYSRDQKVEAQLKAGPCALDHYNIGDSIEGVKDGIYIGYYGFVTIENGYVVGVTNSLFNTDGGLMFTADDLMTFNSKFYRLLYGDKYVNEKEKKVEKLVAKFRKVGNKIRKAKNGKTVKKTRKTNKTK